MTGKALPVWPPAGITVTPSFRSAVPSLAHEHLGRRSGIFAPLMPAVPQHPLAVGPVMPRFPKGVTVMASAAGS